MLHRGGSCYRRDDQNDRKVASEPAKSTELRGRSIMKGGRGGKTVSKVNLISRAPVHAGNRAREGVKRGGGRSHFDVKRGAPGPTRHSTRAVIVITRGPGPFLIIVKEPEVAACDIRALRSVPRSVNDSNNARSNATIESRSFTCMCVIYNMYVYRR